MPSLNDLAVDGTLNTTNQPTNIDTSDNLIRISNHLQRCLQARFKNWNEPKQIKSKGK